MKRIALWSALAILPLLMGAASFGLYHASSPTNQVAVADCCLDPDCPGCSDKCSPNCLPTATAKACCPEGECCPACCDDCPPCPWCP